jgi:hypothetical protein
LPELAEGWLANYFFKNYFWGKFIDFGAIFYYIQD